MDFTALSPFPSENVSVSDTYYSLGSDCITIRRYIPSHLETDLIRLAQDRTPSNEPVFFFENYYDGNLALLLCNDPDPDVADQAELTDISVTVDHEEYVPAVNHGYMLIAGPFDAGCRIILSKAPFEEKEAEEPEEALIDEDTLDQAIAEEETPDQELIEENTPEEELIEEDEIDEAVDTDACENEDTDTGEEADENEDLDTDEYVDENEDLDTDEYVDENEDLDTDNDTDEDLDEDSEEDTDDEPGLVAPAPGFSHTYEDAEILYSQSKRRYVLKIRNGNGAHAILPDGTEIFARSGELAFKGYRMRIGEEEYDLVVMKEEAVSDRAAGCNAYMPLLGSFQGDCCYCVDTSHPEKKGTHGISRGTAFIDSETGYKWGETAPGCYEFELENGSYNVYAISSSPEGNITSKKDIRKVSGGFLKLYSGNDKFTHISITAADAVISENTSYEKLTFGETVREAAYLYVPEDTSADNDARVADNVDAAEQKTFKAAEFEHITTHTSDNPVSPYVFDTFEVTDETMISHNEEEDENKYRISTEPSVPLDQAAPAGPAQQIDLAIPLSDVEETKAPAEPDVQTEDEPATDIKPNIKVSTYTVVTPEVQKKNAAHQNAALKAKKARQAATAAGIAAGAALVGSLIKALTGRKK